MDKTCKNCDYWKSSDREKGYCNQTEDDDNKSFWIEDTTAYRPQLMTLWSFCCNLHCDYGDFDDPDV